MSLTGILAITKAGANRCTIGRYGDDGFPTNFDGTAITQGDQNGNGGMTEIDAINAVPLSIPESESVSIVGNDSTIETFQFEAATLPELVLTCGVFDLNIQSVLQGTSVAAYGGRRVGILLPDNPEYPNLYMNLQSSAKVRDPEIQRGQPLFHGYLFLNIQLVPLDADNIEARTEALNQYKLTTGKRGRTPWGETISASNFGACNGVILPYTSEFHTDIVHFLGDGAETTFNLPFPPAEASGDKVSAFLNGAPLTYGGGADYTVSVANSTITFTAAHPAGANLTVWYEYDEEC